VDITQQLSLLQPSLACIGSSKAAALSHLCINFPTLEEVDGQLGELKLRDDSLQSLELLGDRCANLSTLETLVHSKGNKVFRGSMNSTQQEFAVIK
jgi:hypothetical protein